MRVFEGSLRLADNPVEILRAAVTVEEERLVVTSGRHEIGAWTIGELVITDDVDGFHLQVEGEELILTLSDRSGFAATIGGMRSGGEQKVQVPKRRKAGKPTQDRPTRRTRRSPEWRGRSILRRPREAIRDRVEEIGGIPTWWVGLAAAFVVLVVLAIVSPTTVAVLLVVPGLAMLLAGALAITDPTVRVRLPGPLEPTAYLGIGLGLLVAGFAVFGLA